MKLNESLNNMWKVFEEKETENVELGFELAKLEQANSYAVKDIVDYLEGGKSICLNFYELIPLFSKYGYEKTLKYFKHFFCKKQLEKEKVEGEKENA